MATPTTLPATFVAGNVLTAAQMNDLRGAFRILQVVSTTKTDTFTASVASGGETAVTGLSASITPSSATSKILVMLNVNGIETSDYTSFLVVRLYRGATEIGSGAAAGSRPTVFGADKTGTQNSDNIVNVSGNYLDSPATTSATTYAVYLVNTRGVTKTLGVNRTGLDSDQVSYVRAASTVTLMEVSA
jgi:hypothetical protein